MDAYAAAMATEEGKLGLAQAQLRYETVVRLTHALEDSGLTQKEVAHRLQRSESAVSQMLGGDRNLTLNTIAAYAHALGACVKIDVRPAEYAFRPLLRGLFNNRQTGTSATRPHAIYTQDRPALKLAS